MDAVLSVLLIFALSLEDELLQDAVVAGNNTGGSGHDIAKLVRRQSQFMRTE